MPAVPEHHQDAHRQRDLQDRRHRAAQSRQAEALLQILLVRHLEGVRLTVFERERTHYPNTRNTGLHSTAHFTERGLRCTGAHVKLRRESARDQQQDGQRQHGGGRELRRHRQNHEQRANQRENGVDDVEHTKAEQQSHLRQVVRHPTHDLAGVHAPVERRPEGEQFGRQHAAELVLGVATGIEPVSYTHLTLPTNREV